MMKKLLTAAVLVASFTAVNAQKFKLSAQKHTLAPGAEKLLHPTGPNQQARTATIASFDDTLHYFYNKHRFINQVANGDQLFNILDGEAVGSNTVGALVEFGSSFLNGNGTAGSGAQVTVSGAFFLASVKSQSGTIVPIPVMMYLYNASSTGVPSNKVDSVAGVVNDTLGLFYYLSFATPRTVSGSFFISYRAMPNSVTDTLWAWVSAALTPTIGTIANGVPNSEKYGESLGFTRVTAVGSASVNNGFISNTDNFGQGFDPEPQILPTVSFSINSNFTAAAPNPTTTPVGSYCTNKVIAFTNATAPPVYNRQFNFNKFITYWGASTGFSNTTLPLPADPIDNWTFSDNAAVTVTTTNASNTPATAGVLTVTLETQYRPSPFLPTAQKTSTMDVKTATYNVVACTTTFVGIPTVAGFEAVSVYPNPTINGKTTISGLNGMNTILVYDLLGQQVAILSSDKETVTVDLLNKPNGSYIVKIINANNNVKVTRIVHQN